jgi:hypothetical protein
VLIIKNKNGFTLQILCLIIFPPQAVVVFLEVPAQPRENKMQDKTLNEYPDNVRIAGLEMLFQLLISAQSNEQKIKFSTTALELIKTIKLSSDEVRINELEDYLANTIERVISL